LELGLIVTKLATELIAVADFDQPGVVLRRSMPKDTRP
jgi:hypothetical protein